MRDKTGVSTDAIRRVHSRSSAGEHSSSIYMTSSYVFDSAEDAAARFSGEKEGYIYSRYGNPNNTELINKMIGMEHAEAGVCVSSGMAAIFAVLAGLLKQGDHILACRQLFGSTHQLLQKILPAWGISHSYADLGDPDTWDALVLPSTRIIIAESPVNPTLDLLDLSWLGRFAEERGLTLIIDNTFATPVIQTPLTLGAHLSVHSTTKFLDGQGRSIGGVILGRRDLIEKISFFTRQTGPSLSPFNAWIVSKSLETLSLRMEKHSSNALALAEWLEDRPGVGNVKYPHLPSHPQYELARKQMCLGGGLVSFELEGGLEQGRRFLNSLQMLSLSANLGDTRSIATHPASTTHSRLSEEERRESGITDGLVRISCGLEDIEDIKADIGQALET